MIVVPGTAALASSHGRLLVVVGVFDGLHLGHEYLLRELRRVASEHDARPAVITFDHHPDEILKGAAPPLLCDPEERLDRLANAGVEVTVIETFDRALRETPYDVWVRGIAERVDLAGFLMTPESAFGYERGGNPATVAELGRSVGYDVVVTPQFLDDRGQPVSSSAIRKAIEAGDLVHAERLIGRPYAVTGTADGVGAPTTLALEMPVVLPPAGMYDVLVGGQARRAEVTGDGHVRIGALAARGRQRVAFLGRA